MFHLSGLRHHYVLLQPKTSYTVSEQENHQLACCMQSRLVLQQTASLPSRNSAKEQEVTNNLRAPFQGIFIPKLRFHALLQTFLKLHQDGLKVSHTPQNDSTTLLLLLPSAVEDSGTYAVIHCVMFSAFSWVRSSTSPNSKKPTLDPQYLAAQHLNPICLVKQQQSEYPRCLHNAFGEYQKCQSHNPKNWTGSA